MSKIIEDIQACSKGSKVKFIKTIFLNSNFHCVLLYRISHFLYKIHIPIIPPIIKFINKVIYSVDIDYRADLAGGFVLIHGIGVVIGAAVKTLGPVKVYQGVTLGGNNFKERIINGELIVQPLIYGNVILYANACVFGPVIVGKNTIIGAGTIIKKDVPPNMKVFSKQEILTISLDKEMRGMKNTD
ncbi:hypothetical protein K2F40_05900 [Clostridium sp. CM028]|uniref:serine O-acetyltransferase n=1 Tax=Clostridium TaxID=1485 RepID=UPI0013EE6C88|nr:MULTISPECIES: hypothetical protein [Clostridium]MBW9148507.1 hypothetical protein [Clostridium sp. CM028]MBZ9609341.1 hypothetical protein [Clostridium estertheticum]WLC61078.1 hypothetical protein KTC94_13300 [Clostridium sp. CM028]